MDFQLEPKHQATLREVRAYLDHLQADGVIDLKALAEHYRGTLGPLREPELAFIRQLGRDGWLGIGTPKEYGGQGRSFLEQWLFQEELKYRRLPTGSMLIQAVIPTLILFASEEMKRRFLPICLGGEPNIAIGYSEPGAGTDLAALTTTATRSGSGYKVNGQKTWCSHAHTASHFWLAARTGTLESRHRGISLFIIPADLSGITIQPIYTELGERVNDVFFANVALTEDMRVGEENDGWKYIMAQLNFERVFCFAEMMYDFHSLVKWWADRSPAVGAERDFQRLELAKLAANVQVCRLMAMRSAWLMDTGQLSAEIAATAASIAKIVYGTTHQLVGIEGFRIMGPAGQLAVTETLAAGGGRPARAYLSTPVFKFGGGTNELQRDLIAGFGLKMPRTR